MRPARPLDYLFFMRPVLLVPVWTVFLLGHGGTESYLAMEASVWAGLLAMTAVFAGVFVLNQYFDVESDRLNGKCLFLASGLIGRAASLRFYAALNLVAGMSLYWAPWAGPFLVWILILGVVYSAPPWRWKDRPYLGLAANVAAHGLLVFQAGRMSAGGDLASSLVASLPYGCGVAAVFLLTTIPDLEGDRQAGKKTVAVTLGAERTARWALGWFLAALLLGVYGIDLLFVLAVLPALPAFAAAGSGDLRKLQTAVRWSVGGLSLAAALWHPWYALFLALGFWSTRVYYRKRWACIYP